MAKLHMRKRENRMVSEEDIGSRFTYIGDVLGMGKKFPGILKKSEEGVYSIEGPKNNFISIGKASGFTIRGKKIYPK